MSDTTTTTSTTTTSLKSTKKTAKSSTASNVMCYIGPDIVGVVKKNTIFNNGLPKALTDKATEIKAINSLIVSIDNLASSMAELSKTGSAFDVLYKKVEKESR